MENIKKFIMDYIERKGKLSDDTDLDSFNFVKSGHIDSIAVFKFVVDIEAEFDIEISDEDMMSPQFMTIGGLVGIISEKKRDKND